MKRSHSKASSIYYGYVVVGVAFCLQAFGWGVFNSFGVFFKPFMDEFRWSRALIAGAFSLSTLVFGISSVLMGRLSDRFGPRLVMTGGGIVLGAGYLFLSRISELWHLYIFGSLVVGFGISGTDVVLLSTSARWFIRTRGMMTGIIKVGTGVGMLAMPLLINWMIRDYGWRTAFLVLGGLSWISYGAFSQLLVRDPDKMGLAPDNVERDSPPVGGFTEPGLSVADALKTPQFWIISGAYVLVLFCVGTVLMHIVPHAIDLGISPTRAAYILAIVGGVSIAGRFVMGGTVDRIGGKRSLVVCFVCLCGGLIWLLMARNMWMMVVFGILHGFAHGGFFALIATITAEFFGIRFHGAILGIVTFAATIGSALGPVLAGWIFDVTGNYHIVFLMLVAAGLSGLAAAAALRPIFPDEGSHPGAA